MGREKAAQRLGYIWNSPCRQVFSPGCHFHLNSQDCPHLPPACRRFPRSLEQLRRGDDLKPGRTGGRVICVPETSDRSIPSQSVSSQHFIHFCSALAPCVYCTMWRRLRSQNQREFVAKTIKKSATGVTWGTISPSNQSLESLQSAHLMQSIENVAWCALLPLKLFLQKRFKNLFLMAGSESSGAIAHPKSTYFGLFPSERCSGSFLLPQSPCWDSELPENSSEVLRDLHSSTLSAKNLCTQNWKLSTLSW